MCWDFCVMLRSINHSVSRKASSVCTVHAWPIYLLRDDYLFSPVVISIGLGKNGRGKCLYCHMCALFVLIDNRSFVTCVCRTLASLRGILYQFNRPSKSALGIQSTACSTALFVCQPADALHWALRTPCFAMSYFFVTSVVGALSCARVHALICLRET